jgi:hypothetical protein
MPVNSRPLNFLKYFSVRRWISVLFIVSIFSLLPGGIGAQQRIAFSTLQIDLWPEYDRPTMLVIFRARLSPDVQLPATITFRIPAAAGEPNAVAERPENGGPLNVEYTRDVEGDWALIRLTATLPNIQLEYYDPAFEKDGSARNYVYQWPGDYDVDQLIMLVQQPTGATDLQTFPRLSNITQDAEGVVYYGAEIGSLKASETFELTVSYQKESDSLTAELLPIQPSAPITVETPGRVNFVNIIPWGIGLLGVAIIVAGVYWYWASGQKQVRSQSGKRQRRRQTLPETTDNLVRTEEHFCHQCGKRAEPGDRFCRACGTKLRT